MRALRKLRKTLSNNQGFTLIEIILIIVVFAIAIPTLMNLVSATLESSNKSYVISQATIYAQEKLEEIIADKKSPAKGYDWVTAPGRYQSYVPGIGFTRSVVITTTGNSHNGIPYAFVQVTVVNSEIPDIELTTWLTDY